MKLLLTTLLVADALSGCVTTTYIDPYTGARTQTVQPAPGVAEAVVRGVAVGAVAALNSRTSSYHTHHPTRGYYRRYF
jgi:hypothetical protein